MPKKWFYDDLIKTMALKNPDVVLIGEFITVKDKTTFKCVKHDYEWEAYPSNILAGKGCPLCRSEKIRIKKRKSSEQFIRELSDKNPNVQLIGNYTESFTKTTFHCLIHNIEYETTPVIALKGCGCPQCHLERNWHKRRKTQDQYVSEVKAISPHIKVIGKYEGINKPIPHLCTKHNIEWNPLPSVILSGAGCHKCMVEKLSERFLMNPSDYTQKVHEISPDIIPIGIYKGMNIPIEHYHISCGHITLMQPGSVMRGSGCVLCKGNKIRKAFVKTQVQFENELKEINPSIKVTGKYTRTIDNMRCECLNCGHQWEARANHLLEGHGCPQCQEPIGERKIRQYFESKGIQIMRNKKFRGLTGVGGGLLSFDFYIRAYNLLIEFQGEQHERSIDLFGGSAQLKIQKEHDAKKKTYAQSHGYNFLEIYYRDIDNVESILDEFISSLKSETVTTTGDAQ